LLALGLTQLQAQSSLRISLGWETSKADLDSFIETFLQVVNRLRSFETPAGVTNV